MMIMFYFWFIPVLIVAVIALVWFVKRVSATSPAHSDSDVITTDQAVREERAERLR